MPEYEKAPVNLYLPNLGVDFDGVLFRTDQLMEKLFMQWNLGFPSKYYTMVDPPKEFKLAERAFKRNRDFISLHSAFAGAPRMLAIVSGRYANVYGVSNRWEDQKDDWLKLLEKRYMQRFFCDILLRQYQPGSSVDVNERLEVKRANIRKLNIEFFVEDEVEIGLGLTADDPPVTVFLIDNRKNRLRPGSEDLLPNHPYLIRCRSLLDIALGVQRVGSLQGFAEERRREIEKEPDKLFEAFKENVPSSTSLLAVISGKSIFSLYQ